MLLYTGPSCHCVRTARKSSCSADARNPMQADRCSSVNRHKIDAHWQADDHDARVTYYDSRRYAWTFMTTDQQPSTTVPSWPSLYNPGIEILHIEHNAPIQPQGAYLYRAKGGVITQKTCVDLAHKYFYKRRFPIYVILDSNLLYPAFLVLWIVCLLELRFPSITSPSKLSQIF